MPDGRHIKNRFGHKSEADCHFSVKFRVGKQFFIEFRQWDRYRHIPQNVLLLSLMRFWLRQAVAFVSSPIDFFGYNLTNQKCSWMTVLFSDRTSLQHWQTLRCNESS